MIAARTVVCVDPSSGDRNGVATWQIDVEGGKHRLVSLKTLSPVEVIDLFDDINQEADYKTFEIRIADDSAISAIYAGRFKGGDSLAVVAKKAEHVGAVKAISKLYIELAKRLVDQYPDYIKLITIANTAKNSTKHSSELFNRLTGWTGQSNEHTRDAAMLYFKCGNQVVSK